MEMILECFEDLMLQILCVAAAVSTGIGILQEGLASGWMEVTWKGGETIKKIYLGIKK